MALNNALKAKAKRAYELGRFKRALLFAPLPLPLIALSLKVCSDRSSDLFALLMGGTLIAVLVYFAWRGEAFGRAVIPGMLAGLGAFAAPFLGEALNICPCESAMDPCVAFCFTGGLIAGGIVGLRAVGDRKRFIKAGGAIAVLVGGLGCSAAGVGGVLGMTAGLGLFSAVVLARA